MLRDLAKLENSRNLMCTHAEGVYHLRDQSRQNIPSAGLLNFSKISIFHLRDLVTIEHNRVFDSSIRP